MVVPLLSLEDILQAKQRIKNIIRQTPFLQVTHARHALPYACKIFLSLEVHQLTGSFKIRGVLNKVCASLPQDVRQGLVAASGGNHGRAVAYAGWKYKSPATIYLPTSTPQQKIEAIQKWGAEVILEGQDLDEANELARAAATADKKIFIHPYADLQVIQGQGTLGLEIFEALKPDVVLVAVGGGGLIGGLGAALKHLNPQVKVIGIEPVGCPTFSESLKAGEIKTVEKIATQVGTLTIRRTSPLNFELAQRYVDDIVLVTDQDMTEACQWLWQELAVASEWSGAAPVAALLKEKVVLPPQAIVCAIIGGSGKDGISV